MSTAMVGLGIATGFERSYGVLKRLGSTPLTRGQLLIAKTISVVVIELVQLVLLTVVSALLGWSPGDDWVLAIVAVVLGTVAFAGIGMTMAGTLRGEINLAAANGLYLVLLLLGGMVVPLAELPGALRAFSRLLPAGALAEVMHGTIGAAASVPARSWVVLVAWAVGAPLVAARLFRWE
jgi:ABC-2 type transport system permease protein